LLQGEYDKAKTTLEKSDKRGLDEDTVSAMVKAAEKETLDELAAFLIVFIAACGLCHELLRIGI